MLPFPAGYNVQTHQKFRLSEDLDEISGIGFDTTRNRILAIQDEDGRVYHINPENGDEIEDFKFGKSGDYEDIAQTPAGWFYLKSNGNLYFAGDSVQQKFEAEKISYPRKDDEFESLYFDPQREALMMICKECDSDKNGSPGVYSYSIAEKKFSDEAVFTLEKPAVDAKLKKPDEYFRPSAAAIHPVQKKLYILASQQKLLVIASTDGKIEQVFPLDKKLFKQAEGICFKPNGDMFISNEAADGYANILYFPYKP
ncbi:MAG: SdiA-regulated domain-containing protein [Mucilaginibacter polytrichastri]|nr:SdiA-regulated domain-containing protein [Mucilaginibacter polytrichastri]